MRFLLDEDVNPAVAEIAQGLGLDVLSVHGIDRLTLPDEDQLRYSASQSRIIVTRNRNDFIRLGLVFFQTGEHHEGILIVSRSLPNDRPDRIAHALKRWHEQPGDRGPCFVDFLSA
jgi:predicted nuclease of predicted toxin-antitoxin system